MKWLRLTEDARRAIARAQEQAARGKSPFVTPEHVLFGLLRDPTSRAARVISDLGVDAEIVIREFKVGISTPPTTRWQKFFAWTNSQQITPLAKHSIDLANEEANRQGSECIGTEPILIGVLCARPACANRLGISVDRVRAAVYRQS